MAIRDDLRDLADALNDLRAKIDEAASAASDLALDAEAAADKQDAIDDGEFTSPDERREARDVTDWPPEEAYVSLLTADGSEVADPAYRRVRLTATGGVVDQCVFAAAETAYAVSAFVVVDAEGAPITERAWVVPIVVAPGGRVRLVIERAE